jgi:hypothetical protein
VGVGHERDAVGAQRVEGVLELVECAVDVRQRQGGERAEPAGVVRDHSGGVFVDLRAGRRAAASSPKCTPGDDIDNIAVAIPCWSMSSRWASTDQSGQRSIPSRCS